MWAKQVTDSESSRMIRRRVLTTVCAASHPPLAKRLQTLYETAYTQLNGTYFPCHPEVCGPLTEVRPGSHSKAVRHRLTAGGKGADRQPVAGWPDAMSQAYLFLDVCIALCI